jgi:hypothetical protein
MAVPKPLDVAEGRSAQVCIGKPRIAQVHPSKSEVTIRTKIQISKIAFAIESGRHGMIYEFDLLTKASVRKINHIIKGGVGEFRNLRKVGRHEKGALMKSASSKVCFLIEVCQQEIRRTFEFAVEALK